MEELEGIVQKMIDAGESEDNIAKVVQEYNKTSGGEEAAAQPKKPNPIEAKLEFPSSSVGKVDYSSVSKLNQPQKGSPAAQAQAQPVKPTVAPKAIPTGTAFGIGTPQENLTNLQNNISKDLATKQLQQENAKAGNANAQITPEQIAQKSTEIKASMAEAAKKGVQPQEYDFWDDTIKKVKANSIGAASQLAKVPSALNQMLYPLLASDKELEDLNKLSPEAKKAAINKIVGADNPLLDFAGAVIPTLGLATSLPKSANYMSGVAQNLDKKVKGIQDEMQQFDTNITDDIANGDIAQAGRRIASEGIGSIPSIVQAMIPYVGIGSIVAGSAAEKQNQLLDEGENVGWRTTANSLINGSAEGLFEMVTQKLGGKLWGAATQAEAKAGIEGVKSLLSSTFEHLIKDPTAEGASEALTSTIQDLSDKFVQGKEVDFNKAFKRATDAFLIGFGTGTGMGATTLALNQTHAINDGRQIDEVVASKDNNFKTIKDAFKPNAGEPYSLDQLKIASRKTAANKLDYQLKQDVKDGNINEEQAAQYKHELAKTQQALSKTQGIPMQDGDRVTAVNLIQKKEQLLEQVKNMDDALAIPKKEQIKQIDAQLQELAAKAEVKKPNAKPTTNETNQPTTEPVQTNATSQETGTAENRGQATGETNVREEITADTKVDTKEEFDKGAQQLLDEANIILDKRKELQEGTPEYEASTKELATVKDKIAGFRETNKEFSQEAKPTEAKPLTEGSKVNWDNQGTEPNAEWTVGKETTTESGEPAVELTREVVSEDGDTPPYTDTQVVPTRLLQEQQNQVAPAEATITETSNTNPAELAVTEGAPKPKEKVISEKTKKVSKSIRDLKINSTMKDAMSKLSSNALFEVAWDGALETVAMSVELSGDVAQAVYDGLNHLRSSPWFQSLSDAGKAKAERMFQEDLHRIEGVKKAVAATKNTSYGDTVKAGFQNLQQTAIQKFVDKYSIARKAVNSVIGANKNDKNNFSQAEILLHGKAANDLEVFDKTLQGIYKKMHDMGLTPQQVSDYMYAKHATERNEHIKNNIDEENEFGSGMTPQEIDKILNGTFNPEQIANLEKVSKEFSDIIDGTRNIMKDFGLITDEEFNNLKDYYKDYVPLTGFENQDISASNSIEGNKLDVQGTINERSAGRSTRADNVIANIIKQRIAITMKARKNEVLQTLYHAHETNPDNDVMKLYTKESLPKSTSVNADGTVINRSDNTRSDEYVGLKVDGVQHFVKFANKEIGRVLNAASTERTSVVARTLSKLNRYLSTTMTTLNPDFVLSNFSRDIQTALYNAMAEADINPNLKEGIAAKMVKDTPKAIRAIYGNERNGKTSAEFQKYYEEFKANGAKTGWANQMDLAEIKKHLENSFKEYEASGLSYANAKKGVKKVGKFIEDVNTSVENGVRLSAYIHGRKAGMTQDQAARMAKELTVNFNKSGEYGAVANSIYLFFNAGIQGSSRFVKAMGTMKKTIGANGEVKKSLNNGQKLALAMTVFAGALTAMNQAISDDDEDGKSFYEKIPDSEKERNMILMNPMNPKEHFKIPLPYGYNIFHNIGTTFAEVANGDRTVGDGLGFLTMATVGAFSPISVAQGGDITSKLGGFISPTALKPIWELHSNEDAFGSQIYNDNLPFSTPKPDASLARNNTPEVFKATSRFLNEVSGGNEAESGGLDVHPESLYHIYKFGVGGAGRFVSNTFETGGALLDQSNGINTKVEARKLPFAGRFYGEQNNYVDQKEYFDRYDKIRQKKEAVETEVSSPEDKRKKNKIIAVEAAFAEVSKKLKDIRAEKAVARGIENPRVKANKMNKLEELSFSLMKKANKIYNKKLGKDY